jgi:hypothetical protein
VQEYIAAILIDEGLGGKYPLPPRQGKRIPTDKKRVVLLLTLTLAAMVMAVGIAESSTHAAPFTAEDRA